MDGLVLSYRKYVINILEERGVINAKLVNTQMDSSVKHVIDQGKPCSVKVSWYSKLPHHDPS